MAPNKKPKVNFSDALKAKADELSAKRRETIRVKINGIETTIARGNMDDAQWARLTQRAEKPKPQVLDENSPGATIISEEYPNRLSWSDVMSISQNLGTTKGVFSDEEMKDLPKVNEWTRAEFVRQRLKNKGYDVPEETADQIRSKLSDTGSSASKLKEGEDAIPPTVKVGEPGKPQGTPEEWKPAPVGKPTASGTQTEDAPPTIGSSIDPRNPASAIPSLAMGAVPVDAQSGPGRTDAEELKKQQMIDEQRSAKVDLGPMLQPVADLNAKIGQIPSKLMQAVSLPPAVSQAINTPVQGPMFVTPGEQGGAGMGDALKSAARGLGNITGDVPMGGTQPTNADPLDPQAAAPGIPPLLKRPEEPAPGGAGASLAMQMPGGFSPVGPDPAFMQEWKKGQQNIKQLASDAEDNLAALGFARDAAVRQAGNESKRVQEEAYREAALAKEAQLTAVRENQRYMGAKMAVEEEARRVASTPTDPNRFWNNKDAGQKAAAIIAGALFGFAGKGMDWLQRIDGLIEADMNAQRADRAAAVQGLDLKARGLGEAGQMALRNGATIAEAHIIEKNAKLEGLKSYLEQVDRVTQNMAVKQQAQMMMLEIANKQQALNAQGVTLAQQAADSANEQRYRNAQLSVAKFNAMAKLAGKGAGGKQKSISPTLVARISNTEQMIATLKNMRELAQNKGFLHRMYRSGAETLTDAENAKLKQYEAGQFEIARLRAGSSLQKPEQEALLPLISKRSGYYDPVPAIDEAIKRAQTALEIEKRNAEGATAGALTDGVPESDFPETAAE